MVDDFTVYPHNVGSGEDAEAFHVSIASPSPLVWGPPALVLHCHTDAFVCSAVWAVLTLGTHCSAPCVQHCSTDPNHGQGSELTSQVACGNWFDRAAESHSSSDLVMYDHADIVPMLDVTANSFISANILLVCHSNHARWGFFHRSLEGIPFPQNLFTSQVTFSW